MVKLRVCPNCLGEGERRTPQWGYLQSDGKWIAGMVVSQQYAVVSPCNPCRGTGYLKILT